MELIRAVSTHWFPVTFFNGGVVAEFNLFSMAATWRVSLTPAVRKLPWMKAAFTWISSSADRLLFIFQVQNFIKKQEHIWVPSECLEFMLECILLFFFFALFDQCESLYRCCGQIRDKILQAGTFLVEKQTGRKCLECAVTFEPKREQRGLFATGWYGSIIQNDWLHGVLSLSLFKKKWLHPPQFFYFLCPWMFRQIM